MTDTKPQIPVEMETKLSTLLNDKRVLRRQNETSTFHSCAMADASLEHSGRHGATTKPPVFDHSMMFPKLPAEQWSNQAAVVPDEPPLGFSVHDHEPVGRQDEIEASIAALERTANQQGDPSHADGRSVEADGSVVGHNIEPPLTQSPTGLRNSLGTNQRKSRND